MLELDLLTQLDSLIKRDHLNEPELNYGWFSSHLSCLSHRRRTKLWDLFNYVFYADDTFTPASVSQRWRRWSLLKCCGMSAVQIWRRRGGVVSSSLHKPSTADREVVRGVTEHSKWTSQTLRGASSGLPLMLPDLASGTERKCCRTRRGHRRSRPWSACQPADCGRVRGDRKEARESPQEGDFKNKGGKERKKREGRRMHLSTDTCVWLPGPWMLHLTFLQPLAFPIKKSSLFTLTASLHCLSNDLSVLPSLLHGQLNVRPIGQRVNGAAARALQLNNVWQGTNSTGREGTSNLTQTPTELQAERESLED